MALARLQGLVHRFWVAAPDHFEDWQNPTVAEMNANPTNDPAGSIFNLTCALNTDGTTFDLGDPETDDSLTFCQVAGAETVTGYNPEIVYEIERSRERWMVSDTASFNTANLAFSLLAWRGVEYWAIMSVGKGPEAPVAVGDRLKMVGAATDHIVDVTGSGENIRGQQTFATGRLDGINWNYRVAA